MVKTAEESLTPPESGRKAEEKAAKALGGEQAGERAESRAAAEKASGKEASGQEKKPASEEKQQDSGGEALKEDSQKEEPGKKADEEADIEDWAGAVAKIAALEEELAALKEEKAALEAELAAEKEKNLVQKQEYAVKLELIKAGAIDAEYLCYKMGKEAQFDGEGNFTNPEDFVKEAKKRYPALFRAGFSVDVEGVKPGDGGMGSGQRPDTGFLTYSQEQRLRERR